MLALNERDALLREASKYFPDCTQRETARRVHERLMVYYGGRWRRDRLLDTLPPQHHGRLEAVMWEILKTHDHLVSEMTIRRALFVNQQR